MVGRDSIDVEKDYGKEGFEGVENLNKILDIFKSYGASATLFVSGQVLEKYPEKFRKIS